MIEMMQKDEWTHPDWDRLVAKDYIADTPTACYSGTDFAATVGKHAFINGMIAYKAAYPDFYTRVQSMVTDVDEAHGRGNVLVVSHVFNNPPPLAMEGISVVYFLLTKQGWRAVNQITLGGPQAF